MSVIHINYNQEAFERDLAGIFDHYPSKKQTSRRILQSPLLNPKLKPCLYFHLFPCPYTNINSFEHIHPER